MEAARALQGRSWLESQLATLEPLEADEAGIVVDIAAPVQQVVAEALAGIARVKLTAGQL